MPTGTAAAAEITTALARAYPNATYALDWKTPWELLVGSILAAQSTDAQVNRLTPALFAKYRDVRAFAKASVEQVDGDIATIGLHAQKAKGIVDCARAIVERFGGEVPRTMAELLGLPRVQRKTANVVLNTAFRAGEGIVVDLHVARVAPRLGLTTEEKPEKIEQDLMRVFPRETWHWLGAGLILLGRETCRPANPKCGECPLEPSCAKNLGAAPASATKPPAAARPAPARRSPPAANASADGGVVMIDGGSTPASPSGATKPPRLPPGWTAIEGELAKPYFRSLWEFVTAERAQHTVFPPDDDVFAALALTPLDRVKVVLLGQDPYHDDGQAHGLCFSVRRGVKPPPSLANMFKEMKTDLGIDPPDHGCLDAWAKQGVLLLNAVLTVRAHEANSHKNRGWEQFTDAVIRAVNDRNDPVVFALWGAYAQKKGKLVDRSRHVVLEAAHPSPLSATKFFGSRPFSAINEELKTSGKRPIDWRL